jgi:xanthine dehydrogenase accessory factor
MKTADLFELSNELIQQRQPHAWITVVGVKSPSSAYVGAQAIVTSDGQLHGWIGGGCIQSTARAAALGSLTSMTPQRLRLSNSSDSSEDPDVRPMNCPSNGEIELFIQPVAATPRLRIYGNTPVARAAAWLAREADFEAPAVRITACALLGAQPEEVVVVTGHRGREVMHALQDLPVTFSPNPRHAEGQLPKVD